MADTASDMQPTPEETPVLDPVRALMSLFDKQTIKQWWAKVQHGLKQPKDSGEHKWARVQLWRISAPVSGVLVPLTTLIVLALMPSSAQSTRIYEVTMKEAEAPPPLEKIEEPPPPPEDLPEPVDVQVDNPNLIPDAAAIPGPPTPFSPQPAPIDSVAINKSPVVFKGMYMSRNPGSIGSAVARWSPNLDTEAAVLRALRWMKQQQNPDGSWNQTKPAMTAFAILAYLAHGETPASDEFGTTVEYAIRYLVGALDANGRFTGRDGHDYTQPIAAYALCEAYGMTKVPEIMDAAEKAIKVVIKGQNKVGGFNYNLVGPSDERNDTTYTSWCVQALKAAKMAGLYTEGLDDCMKKAVDGVKKNYGGDDGYGGFGYTGPGNKQSGLTGAGVLCLQFLGAANSKECQGGMGGLADWTFNWADMTTQSPIYYRYYITQAKFQHGGDTWNQWNKMFSPALVKNQQVVAKEQSGYVDHKGVAHSVGYWDSPSKSEHTGGNGRFMDTALCTLMLEVYYRYLPTFKVVEAEQKADVGAGDKDNLNISVKIPGT